MEFYHINMKNETTFFFHLYKTLETCPKSIRLIRFFMILFCNEVCWLWFTMTWSENLKGLLKLADFAWTDMSMCPVQNLHVIVNGETHKKTCILVLYSRSYSRPLSVPPLPQLYCLQTFYENPGLNIDLDKVCGLISSMGPLLTVTLALFWSLQVVDMVVHKPSCFY